MVIMTKRKTHDEYVKEVSSINQNIEVVGEYVNAKTKILHKCKIDGYEWYALPNSIIHGHGCPKCAGKFKKTQDEYVQSVFEINQNIDVIGKYVNNKTSILHKCKVDGYEWYAKPYNILNGRGCPRCSKKEKYTQEEYIKKVSEININIEVVGTYINAVTPILHKCKIDGFEWYAAPNSVLSGRGCPKCGGSMKKTHEEYVSLVSFINSDIEVIGTYINDKTKILHKCKIDGFEWFAAPNNILHGHGCPKCNKSRGEKDIALWLSNHAVRYEQQKAFDDCKDIKPLPFDFYLPDYNYCIEYDGEQHYRPIDYFGGEDSFKKTVMHDNIKNDYCKNNDIKLLRIPYYANVKKELLSLYNSIIAGGITKEVAA